jgi:TetR/AcrR family transcriptional regulator of autoinduction and epiphytic fitness
MSIPTPSPRGDAKRRAVIAAAERIFLDQGYANASMDGIAAEAGVSKRTVYNHFASKQELFQAVVAHLYAGLNDTLRRGLPAERPPAQVLAEFAHELLAHLRRPEVEGLFRLIIAERPRFPELALSVNSSGKSTAFALLEDYFAAQHARGALVAPDPWAAANLFVGVLKESSYWPRLLGLPAVDDERAAAAAVAAVMTIHAPAAEPRP